MEYSDGRKSNFFDPFPDLNKSGKDRKKYSFADDYLNGSGRKGSGSNGSVNGKSNEDLSNDSKKNGDGDRTPSEHESEDIEDWPTAPPMEILDSIKGYEMVSFDQTMCPPPLECFDTQPPASSPSQETKDRKIAEEGVEGEVSTCDNIDGIDRSVSQQEEKQPPPPIIIPEFESKLTEEQARSALLTHISDHCCYGKAAAKNMQIKKMECAPAYHYELQTFSEKRETAWTYAAIRPGYTDMMGGGSLGAVPPLPWEIIEQPTQQFKDEFRLVQVPNTGSTKQCHRCRGTGGMTCKDCNGKGWSRCLNCHGDGWMHDSGGHRERCFYCHHSKHGHGQLDCPKCKSGRVNCATCEGQGQIRCFIQLSITWKVNTAEHISERLELPQELIRDVSGQVAFEEESSRVKPVEAFAETEKGIKEASTQLVFQHLNSFSDQKVIRQRHQVRIVPVTKVSYEWKNKLHNYYAFGYENKIHLPQYPQKCCWGCQIL